LEEREACGIYCGLQVFVIFVMGILLAHVLAGCMAGWGSLASIAAQLEHRMERCLLLPTALLSADGVDAAAALGNDF
jgi:hypothetical protein